MPSVTKPEFNFESYLGCAYDKCRATLQYKCWACDVDEIEQMGAARKARRDAAAFIVYAHEAAWDDLIQDMDAEMQTSWLRQEYTRWLAMLRQECWGKAPSTCMHCVAIDAYKTADAILSVIDAMDTERGDL